MNDIFSNWIMVITPDTILKFLAFSFVWIILKKFFDKFRI